MTYNFQISTQNEVIAKLILEMLKGVEGIVIEPIVEKVDILDELSDEEQEILQYAMKENENEENLIPQQTITNYFEQWKER
jgi:hypothetical protein